MKKILIKLFIFISILSSGQNIFAQEYKPAAIKKHNEGVIYYDKKQYNNAIDCFLEAIKIDPNFVNSYYNLGVLYEYYGNTEKAIVAYKNILKLDSYNAEAAYKVAKLSYKQKNYKEAFEYEEEIRKLNGLDTGGKERYAGFAEQYKGAEFAKTYIEQELKIGIDSKILLNQLQTIYKKLNLPETQFEELKNKSVAVTDKKSDENIIKEFGTNVAPNFTLTNLEGKTVQLSDYIGNLVVLDFWATWCGPCKASFPKMQEIVTKYKDKNVVFLFVDTWEQNKPDQTLKKVTQFPE